jgi:hypothetical protein
VPYLRGAIFKLLNNTFVYLFCTFCGGHPKQQKQTPLGHARN